MNFECCVANPQTHSLTQWKFRARRDGEEISHPVSVSLSTVEIAV